MTTPRLAAGLLTISMAFGATGVSAATYSDRSVFDSVTSTAARTVDFDTAAAGTAIPDGSAIDGVAFNYSLDGVSLEVSTGYDTVSGANFLGTDDAAILQDGDNIDLTLVPSTAIGLYIMRKDTLEDNDISLGGGGETALLDAGALQQTLGDGSSVYFLGITRAGAPFTSVSITTPGNGNFLFNIDDIVVEEADTDGDGVVDSQDNCTLVANPPPDGQMAQRDTDGDGFGNRCDPDLNNDGLVTVTDFLILRGVLNSADDDADLNGDGLVTVTDFLILRSYLNQPPGPAGVAP